MRKFLLVVKKDEFHIPEKCNARLRMGNVSLHMDLLHNGEQPMGGGMWLTDDSKKELILTEKSIDYGCPKLAFIDKIILPENLKGYKITYQYPKNERFPYDKGQLVEFSENELIFKDEG